jgi:hypothetical protein
MRLSDVLQEWSDSFFLLEALRLIAGNGFSYRPREAWPDPEDAYRFRLPTGSAGSAP